MMLSISLNGQSIWLNEKTGLVEATSEKIIDISKIVTERDTLLIRIQKKDSLIIDQKKTINKLISIIENYSKKSDEIVENIEISSKKTDSISDRQLKTALASFSRLSIKGEANYDPEIKSAIFSGRFEYNLKKVYLVSTISSLENRAFTFGIGYKFN